MGIWGSMLVWLEGQGVGFSDLGVQSREVFSSEILDLWALVGGQGFGKPRMLYLESRSSPSFFSP